MLMFAWDFEVDASSRFWSRFVFDILLWPKQVTLMCWTQPLGPLCLWQYFSDGDFNTDCRSEFICWCASLSLNPLSDKPNLLSLLNVHCAANRTDSQQTVPIVSSIDLVDRPWTLPLRIDYVAFSRTAEPCRTLRPWWWCCPICPLPSTYASLDWELLSL